MSVFFIIQALFYEIAYIYSLPVLSGEIWTQWSRYRIKNPYFILSCTSNIYILIARNCLNHKSE